jgi:hypothetical protein
MQENVDLARRVYDLWNRGDIDGATETVDPEVTALELEEQGAAGVICRLASAMLWIELDVHYQAQLEGEEIDLIRVKRIARTVAR